MAPRRRCALATCASAAALLCPSTLSAAFSVQSSAPPFRPVPLAAVSDTPSDDGGAIPPSVLSAVDHCYPTSAYSDRRRSAYDAALASATNFTPEGIPLGGDSMTYGEFDLPFFARLLRRAEPRKGDTFVDVGSGAGRVLLAAALLRPDTWSNCHGVELSAPLHDLAIEARRRLEQIEPRPPPIAPCQYTCADCMEEGGAGTDALRQADVAFSYAVTWGSGGVHDRLVRTFGRCLKDGARVISIDLPLRDEVLLGGDDEGGEDEVGEAGGSGGSHSDCHNVRFELIAKEVGPNEETGEETVGLVYRVVRSSS